MGLGRLLSVLYPLPFFLLPSAFRGLPKIEIPVIPAKAGIYKALVLPNRYVI